MGRRPPSAEKKAKLPGTWLAPPCRTVAPRQLAPARISRKSRLLPMPASPSIASMPPATFQRSFDRSKGCRSLGDPPDKWRAFFHFDWGSSQEALTLDRMDDSLSFCQGLGVQLRRA